MIEIRLEVDNFNDLPEDVIAKEIEEMFLGCSELYLKNIEFYPCEEPEIYQEPTKSHMNNDVYREPYE